MDEELERLLRGFHQDSHETKHVIMTKRWNVS